MSGKFSGFYKVVPPKIGVTSMTDNQNIGDQGSYANYTWYQRLVQGSASRITRYREYDLMDNDIEIARSLDTIAEEMVGSDPNSDLPIELVIESEKDREIKTTTVLTLKSALRYWSDVHRWKTRLFKVARVTVKYGDCFFLRKSEGRQWEYIHPKNVIAAIVDEHDMTHVVGWQIKRDTKTPNSPVNSQTGHYGNNSNELIDTFPADDVVWFTLNDDISESAPFGESILRAVYKAQKQKELLEDAILIYRIQRAPERRVFYIDVGKMPPQRVKSYLEQIKNEIHQKKIPSIAGGIDQIDSVYNPQQMSQDFFFACLTLDTKIPLLDGRTLTLSQLIEEFQQNKQNWTYSVDQKTGKLIAGKIGWAGLTRRNANIVRVKLDNNQYVDVTPDHKFVLRNGEERQAQDLKPGDSLMPLYTNIIDDKKYVIDNQTNQWKTLKSQISNHPDAVDYFDYDKNNHNPTNLIEVTNQQFAIRNNPISDNLIEQWKQEFDLIKQKLHIFNINLSQQQKVTLSRYGKCDIIESLDFNTICSMLYQNKCENTDIDTNQVFDSTTNTINHKVLQVIELDDRQDTGCLYVVDPDSNHNFALDCGVYVKNSRPDGRGSKVETLPGGASTGGLDDLEYFQWKVFRGLRIPLSYMKEGQDNAITNDGKTGIAYIMELRFAMYIKRLQGYIDQILDKEFKRYLRVAGIHVDPTSFYIKLVEPENFGIYKEQQLNSDLLSTYSQTSGITHISKRMAMRKYLQLTDEEILTNFHLRVEELGLNPNMPIGQLMQAVYGDQGEGGGLGGIGGLGGGLDQMVAGTAGGGFETDNFMNDQLGGQPPLENSPGNPIGNQLSPQQNQPQPQTNRSQQ